MSTSIQGLTRTAVASSLALRCHVVPRAGPNRNAVVQRYPTWDPPGQVQFMLDYLGFPDSQDDVDKLLKVLDRRRERILHDSARCWAFFDPCHIHFVFF